MPGCSSGRTEFTSSLSLRIVRRAAIRIGIYRSVLSADIVVYFILKKLYPTAPRETNVRSWLYRIRPAVVHRPFEAIDDSDLTVDWTCNPPNPNQVSQPSIHPWMLVFIPSDYYSDNGADEMEAVRHASQRRSLRGFRSRFAHSLRSWSSVDATRNGRTRLRLQHVHG